MEKLDNKIIVVNGQKQLLSEYIGKLIYLNSKEVMGFFKKLNITLPRYLRMEALKKVLEPKFKAEKIRMEEETRTNNENRITNMQRMNRIFWCESFSETEYEEELAHLDDTETHRMYFGELWQNILLYLLEIPVLDDVLISLVNLAESKFDENILPTVREFNTGIDDLFFDAPNEIDGLTPEMFRAVVTRCSTVKELSKVGSKYHINVPKTLKKADLQEMIFKELERSYRLTDPLRKELLNYTVKELEEYAKANDIVASTYFTKEMIVEYILKHGQTTKEHYYVPDLPSTPSISPTLIIPIMIKEEPIIIEPVKEEPIIIEPVKEEPVKEEPIKEEPIKEEPIKEEPVKEEEVIKVEVVPKKASKLVPTKKHKKQPKYTYEEILAMANYDLQCNRLMCTKVGKAVIIPLVALSILVVTGIIIFTIL